LIHFWEKCHHASEDNLHNPFSSRLGGSVMTTLLEDTNTINLIDEIEAVISSLDGQT
jgi:hemerythrin-like domain-containing protein